jgi:Mrp family chromosome partitioning ATPase
MLARLRIGDGSELPERVGITSAVSGEGVTYICRSLALVLNNDANKRVCVVDLNWSSPSQWPDAGRPGVAQVLEGVASLDDVLVPSGNAGLTFLPSGTTSVFDRPLLANNPRLDKVFLELADNFDHVLLDLPAVQATSEALTLAERAGAVAVVVSQGVAPESQVRDALDELHGVKVLGVILNRASSRVPAVIRRLLPGA